MSFKEHRALPITTGMSGFSDRMRSAIDASGLGSSKRPRPMVEIIASIDRSVEELRSAKLTSFQFRRIAAARSRSEHEAWMPIRDAARQRGAR